MKKLLLIALLAVFACGCIGQQSAGAPAEYASEKSIFTDSETGVTVWQLTNSTGEDRIFYQEPNYFGPDGEKFLFKSDRADGQQRLYLLELGTGKIRLVRQSSSFGWAPCWSKDGKEIYVGETGKILVINTDSLKEKEIKVPSGLWITFLHLNPSGQRLVFIEEDMKGHRALSVMNTDGSDYRNLFEVDRKEIYYFDHPIFVDDDTVLVLTRGKDRDFSGMYNVPYLVKLDGTKDRLKAVCSHYDVNVQRKLVLCGSEGYIVDLGGNKVKEFEDLRGHGVWAPDGKTFLMTPDPVPVPSGPYSRKIVLLSSASDEKTVLIVHGNSYDSSLAVHTQPNAQFSPDGKAVIYESDKSGQTDLFMAFLR
jgi:hypothetical protein